MSRMIFVNLPVRDLGATRAFWSGLGFTFNDDYSDERAACMVVSDLACVMLLQEDFFHSFHGTTTPPSGDQVLVCLSATDRGEVEEVCGKAVAAGASALGEPQQLPGMFSWAFRDLDGHVWEVMAMDGSA